MRNLFALALTLACLCTPSAFADRDIGVTLTGGIPHPVTLELMKVFSPEFSSGLAIGGLGIPIRTESGFEGRYGISTLNLHGRWHPWGGKFFLGGVLGAQSFYAQVSKVFVVSGYGNIPARVEAQVNSAIFTPHWGWMWIFDSGFTVGLEMGWQFPFGPRTRISITSDDGNLAQALEAVQQTEEYRNVEREVQNAGDRLGSASLPYVALLRIGWMF